MSLICESDGGGEVERLCLSRTTRAGGRRAGAVRRTLATYKRQGSPKETSVELRILPRSLSDCKSQTLNVMIQVLQFVSNSQTRWAESESAHRFKNCKICLVDSR